MTYDYCMFDGKFTPDGTAAEKFLGEVRERAERATKGPWEAQVPAMTGDWPTARVKPLKIEGRLYGFAMLNGRDAEFIAHSREDTPRLVAMVEMARAELTRIAGNECDGWAPKIAQKALAELDRIAGEGK